MYIGDSLLPSCCQRGHFPPGTDLILYEVCTFTNDCSVYTTFVVPLQVTAKCPFVVRCKGNNSFCYFTSHRSLNDDMWYFFKLQIAFSQLMAVYYF